MNTSGPCKTERKPYHSPVVQTFGTVREITQSVGMTSTIADGGTGQMNKTA